MAIDAGNRLNDAFNLGSFNGIQTTRRGESIGTWIPNVGRDLNDYYRFTMSSASTVSIRLDGLTDNAELELLNSNGSVRRASRNGSATSEAIAEFLQVGTYYIRVYSATRSTSTASIIASTPYTLNVRSTLFGSRFADAGNSLNLPTDLGTYDDRTTTVSQAIGGSDPNDYYRFDLKERRDVNLQLNGLGADASLELFNQVNQQIVARSYQAGTVAESIRTILDPGIYTLRVFSFDGVATNYNLSLSDTNLSVLEQLKSPTLVQAGTLGADYFSLAPGYRRYVFSGNGNVDYGSGLFDRLDLSALNSGSVRWNPVRANGTGGVRYNPGNGDRLFDQLLLNDGREILLEGIEKILFRNDGSVSSMLNTPLINGELTINPTDPLFSQQWNLHMTGVHTAWRFTQGSNRVLIGVQDSGLALNATQVIHPDLRNVNLPTNRSAYIDDFQDPRDPRSHGTAVQGIIAAKPDREGVVGINWLSDLYPLDVIENDTQGLNRLVRATQEMIAAAQPGRKLVINMSLAVEGTFGEEPRLTALGALEQVIQQNPNVLFVIAAGNSGQLGKVGIAAPAYLAMRYGNVIAVGASGGRRDPLGNSRLPGTRTNYSQYGTGLTMMGPTEHVTTRAIRDPRTGQVTFNTYPNNPTTSVLRPQDRRLEDLAFDGTSAATPNVTGIASLVWSANPTLTAAQVRQILSETALDLGTPGYDTLTGHGFVNADAAVRRALAIARA